MLVLTYFLVALFTLILAKDKCGQHECADQAFNQSYHFYLQGCFCDTRCEVYGDCCVNYNSTDISTSDKYGESNCVALDDDHALMMVTSCSKEYSPESEISQNCYTDTGHPAWGIPVTSIESKIVYKNMFCALCNSENHYTFWNIRIECPEEIDTSNLSKTLDENMEGCNTKMENLEPSYEHKCNSSIISSCPQGTKDEQTVKDCRNGYYGVVYDLNGTMYKNIFCFNCNVNKSEEILCHYDTGPTIIEMEARLSFSVLLNFNRDVTVNKADHLVRMNPCKEGYIYTNGECRKKLQVEKSGPKCTQVKLNNHEFVFLANGTLYHNSTKTFHGKEYYSINDTSRMDVYICMDRILNKDVQRIPLTTSETEIQLTYVCSVISMIALAILIAKFLYFRNIRSLSGFIYVSFAITLFIAQLLFVLTPHFSKMVISSCRAVAVVMHYAFLSSFFWLNSITINIWLSVCWTPCQSKKYSEKRSFISYSAFSWLAPILLIVPAILLDKYQPNSIFAPSYGLYEFCWINNGSSIMLFFAGPLALIILINMILYIHTAVTIYKLRKFTQQHSDRNDVVAIFINMKLCLLTGITWSIGYVAIVTHSYHLRVAFIFLNSSFGLWVAMSFLFTRSIFTKMKQKIRTLTETGE
ncbi:probable G-protein coupled receptor Mth-like 3 [Octopus bimaculoides]|uniref:G-protein coupled receptors family 2 profile 2 domain-containing protein n=1 Tax=Octopus bimaculoides TaxID=37653 RepID=A0A0L8HX80_OCTBM|nr:probable G-protein coupled receptor Mth-like 3 [Octopus bimaculoides]|eukprot:XP_014768920.1 PREDICTED: probable G-protein coupled receptor Mth-like 3 [Octopus bimaculoides]